MIAFRMWLLVLLSMLACTVDLKQVVQVFCCCVAEDWNCNYSPHRFKTRSSNPDSVFVLCALYHWNRVGEAGCCCMRYVLNLFFLGGHLESHCFSACKQLLGRALNEDLTEPKKMAR
jgi:hypothetical protein